MALLPVGSTEAVIGFAVFGFRRFVHYRIRALLSPRPLVPSGLASPQQSTPGGPPPREGSSAMETSNLELIITAVSITGTILAAVLGAFGFLLRELRSLDTKVDGQSAEITAVRVSVARIEGHLGIGFPESAGVSPTADDARTGDAAGPAARTGAEVA